MLTYSTSVFSLETPDEKNMALNIKKKYPVEILIDSIGVPHIYGSSAEATSFGLGYMHARDRYFQMELITRTVEGCLSEIMGKSTIESDIFWKPYSFEVQSEEILKQYMKEEPELYRMIIAYAEGVNHYLENSDVTEVSPEYKALGLKPRKWKPFYSVMSAWYMSYVLSYRNAHSYRQELIDKLPANLLCGLYDQSFVENCYSIQDSFFVAPSATKKERQISWNVPIKKMNKKARVEKDRVMSHNIGSNCWVVAPQKTVDKKVILCNDAHLELTLPSAWYEVQLCAPDFHTHGFSVVCSPLIISGFNEFISWGITNAEWDMVDMYELEVDKNKQGFYFMNGVYKPIDQKEYIFKIRNNQDTLVVVRSCEVGRVMTSDNKVYAEYWRPAEYNNALSSFFKILKSRNHADFINAIDHYAFAPLNIFYADKHGNIAMSAAGKLPYKMKSYNGGILKGNSCNKVDWVGNLELPHSINPASGFILNANQKPAPTNYYLNYEWTESFRAKSIKKKLNTDSLLSIDYMKNMQNDRTDEFSQELEKFIIKYDKHSKLLPELEKLKDWNGFAISKQFTPLAFKIFSISLTEIFNELFGRKYIIQEFPGRERIVHFLNDNSAFVLKDTTIKTEDLLDKAVVRYKNKMVTMFGKDYLTKSFMGNIELQGLLRIPGTGQKVSNYGGTPNSINMNSYESNGVSMRMIIEMSDSIQAYSILAGGQSGRLNSTNYKDQLNQWKNGLYHKIQFKNKLQELKNIKQTIKFY